jgi:hypothetical protein
MGETSRLCLVQVFSFLYETMRNGVKKPIVIGSGSYGHGRTMEARTYGRTNHGRTNVRTNYGNTTSFIIR